jgi:hypothetical protein
MFSYFQALDTYQSDVLLNYIRSIKPTVYYSRIGAFFLYPHFSITYKGGSHLKDLSSARNSVSADTESAWVATLSNIFEARCRFHGFLCL